MKYQKQTFTFGENKTFFGLTIYEKGIKEYDIKQLPFYEFWEESSFGSTCTIFQDEIYINMHDWESFCFSFVLHGTHRFQKKSKKQAFEIVYVNEEGM